MSIRVSIYISIHTSIRVRIHVSLRMPIHKSAHVSTHMSTRMSIHMCTVQVEKEELIRKIEETRRLVEDDADLEIEELKEKYEVKVQAEKEVGN